MAGNVLCLPFRKTHSLAISDAIKQYISSKYEQHPDMFKQDLEVIDNLRRDAVYVRGPHTSGLKKIAAYAAQLVWIGGKFPIDVSSTICQMIVRQCLLMVPTDRRRLHVVPRARLQHRAANIPEQPEI